MTALQHERVRYWLHVGLDHIGAQERAALDRHLIECVECRGYAEKLAALQTDLTRAMRARWQAHQPAPDMEQAIQSRLGRHRKPRRILKRGGSLAATAAFVTLVAVLGWLLLVTGPLSTTLSSPVPTPTPSLVVTNVSFSPDPDAPLDRNAGFGFGAEVTGNSASPMIAQVVAFPVYVGESPTDCSAHNIVADRPVWADQQEFAPGPFTFGRRFAFGSGDMPNADWLVTRVNVIEPGVTGRVLYCRQQVYRLSPAASFTPTPADTPTPPPLTPGAGSATPTATSTPRSGSTPRPTSSSPRPTFPPPSDTPTPGGPTPLATSTPTRRIGPTPLPTSSSPSPTPLSTLGAGSATPTVTPRPTP